jgi:ATP-dependent HslUV protease ATP-binding subunit HslU
MDMGRDVSGEGVQRDMLPLLEGTTVMTRYGPLNTEHILFIAAGTFSQNKPSDLIPELQGRFPLRVELSPLTQHDFERILTEPRNSLINQYTALLATEGVSLKFTEEGIQEIARLAVLMNERMENIGARRLFTIIEKLVEDLSFTASERKGERVVIDADYVSQQVGSLVKDENLSRYIL